MADNETKPTIESVTAERDDLAKRLDSATETIAKLTKASKKIELTKPEEDGTRSSGESTDKDRFVHVERIDFTQDLGYTPSVIHRRATAAVARALGGAESALPKLPDFNPERALTITVEIA